MLTKRIIPCLDILNGRVVKGKKFRQLRDVGNPVELAARYSDEGADELVILDISASLEGRKPFVDVVMAVARKIAIPLTVGGGIRTLDDILTLLRCGADKVSLNTILTRDPSLLTRAAEIVGNQALVAAIDAKRSDGSWIVRVKSGTEETRHDAIRWAQTVVENGAGELLVTSIDKDGMKEGYDLELLSTLHRTVKVPVIASGGAGTKEHILDALRIGKADAVLAASLFHYNELSIAHLKHYLQEEGVPIRL
ncbi:MAG: imidazole glycerol phosphate synthase subunit HisF [Ignavibacteriae bacterium]|nr:imidazole glycerol phosphate synthase subunit HisF [Ignavibacteria bacterium]MBI3365644.1 imidazole glycerol phosphate synthase subunit HisF [Ignavibacteriota bacterium]